MEVKTKEEILDEYVNFCCEISSTQMEYVVTREDALSAMVKFAQQFIDLAAKKAKTKWDFGHKCIENAYVDKQSILDIKQLIK